MIGREARAVIGLYAGYGLALTLPLLALAQGPGWGLAAACASLGAWIRWGPPAMPGLVPGMMALTLTLGNAIVLVVALARMRGG